MQVQSPFMACLDGLRVIIISQLQQFNQTPTFCGNYLKAQKMADFSDYAMIVEVGTMQSL